MAGRELGSVDWSLGDVGWEDGGDARFGFSCLTDVGQGLELSLGVRGWNFIAISVLNLVVDGEGDTHFSVPIKCGTFQPLSSRCFLGRLYI